jgi:hypothetical protein
MSANSICATGALSTPAEYASNTANPVLEASGANERKSVRQRLEERAQGKSQAPRRNADLCRTVMRSAQSVASV